MFETPEHLSVLTLGDPRLRQTAQPVQTFDQTLHQLVDNLIWTAKQTNGVGIAAPQVGAPLRLFIVASYPNLRYPNASVMDPTAMINPRLVAHGDERETGWEGCLSVPDQRGKVDRWKEIEVEYCDRDGRLHRQVLTDFVARIFQHELDHLNGVVFVDHVDDPSTLLTEAAYFAQLGGVSAPTLPQSLPEA